MRDSYIAFRDTLHAVTSTSAMLQRDSRISSEAVLTTRARNIEFACSTSLRFLDRTRMAMLEGGPGTRAPLPRRTTLDKSFIELRAALSTCSTEFKELSRREKAGEIRDRGVVQAGKNLVAIRNFEGAADPFFQSLRIRVRPYGSGANTYAGSSSAPPK